MVGAPVRRQQVTFATKRGLSQRRVCALMSTSRSTLHYESRMEARDGPLIEAMTGLPMSSIRIPPDTGVYGASGPHHGA